MNRQDFKIPGYPLGTDTLDEMQKAYELFNALGEICGDKSIIQGCLDDGYNVGNGVVYVNGELFEFKGGRKQATVVIKQEAVEKTFEDGKKHEVLYKRYVTFGSGPGALSWDAFKRDQQFAQRLADFKAEVEDKLAGKAPLEHNHDDRYYTQNQTDAFFEGEDKGKKQVDWDRVVEKPAAYPPAVHNHDDRYYSKGQLDAFFEGEDKGKKQVHWDRIVEKPTTYPPAAHNHDDRYYLKDQIRDYAYLTDITYTKGVCGDTFYADDKVICSFGIQFLSLSYSGLAFNVKLSNILLK